MLRHKVENVWGIYDNPEWASRVIRKARGLASPSTLQLWALCSIQMWGALLTLWLWSHHLWERLSWSLRAVPRTLASVMSSFKALSHKRSFSGSHWTTWQLIKPARPPRTIRGLPSVSPLPNSPFHPLTSAMLVSTPVLSVSKPLSCLRALQYFCLLLTWMSLSHPSDVPIAPIPLKTFSVYIMEDVQENNV